MATRHSRRLLIVVTAAVAVDANTKAAEVDRDGKGDRTWTNGLSVTGLAPATHYWCGWQMTADQDAALRSRLQLWIDAGQARVFDGMIRTPENVLAHLGLRSIAPDPPGEI